MRAENTEEKKKTGWRGDGGCWMGVESSKIDHWLWCAGGGVGCENGYVPQC